MELEVDGYEQFSKIIDEVRTAFPKTIKNVETVMIHRSRFKWVPYDELV